MRNPNYEIIFQFSFFIRSVRVSEFQYTVKDKRQEKRRVKKDIHTLHTVKHAQEFKDIHTLYNLHTPYV